MSGRDYMQAWRDAKRLLIPPQLGGQTFRWGTDDEYRLARAQWLYDHVSKKVGLADLADLNMYRAARDWEAESKGVPEGDPRRYPPLELRRSA
jgi:hypothetical protein